MSCTKEKRGLARRKKPYIGGSPMWTFGDNEAEYTEEKGEIKTLLVQDIQIQKHLPWDDFVIRKILKILVKDKPISLNKLVKKVKMPFLEVERGVKVLQEKNVVINDGENITMTDLYFYNRNIEEIMDRLLTKG